ncbi:adenylate kinase 9 isoform X2 [Ceratina calcarata]|uniref:Adenylate kinase 9 isoform X2 n=1 Tax=Ceratina calcarata TaxID=156304 RepID=A0AAJ7JD55_9HYME|nr:adenylate kinase 9 isoform X2 [Ceratina calcarata]
MCDERSRRDVRDKREDVRDEFYADSSIITKKSFFRFIKGHPREEYILPWPKPLGCVYPKANAYYAFHEDTNPFTRFPARCESRKYGNIEPHFDPPEEPYMIRDPYYEIEARKKYLACEPTCFVVLGKPDLNTAKLASMIANSWNCVLVSPAALINEEIGRGSEKGKAMADILKAGECLGPEIVMDLMINRVNKRDVLHKGYVVEGLPLISNGTLDYSSYSKSNEKSTSQKISDNLMKFFDSSLDRVCGTANELEKRQKLALSKQKVCVTKSEDTGCTKRPDYERFISGQIEEIFTTWPKKPTIIIYAMCPDEDVVKKREHFRIDPITGRTVDTSLLGMSKDVETLVAHNKLGGGINISFELYQELMNEERILDENQRKYLLRRPADAKSNIEAQCALYKHHALPVIEKWIMLHNPQNVIRVDARTPVSLMFQIVMTRLRTLPVPRVILPRKFVDQVAFEFGESPIATVPTDEFEEKPIEEAFQDLANRETISPLFPWRLSAWNFLCPVELARGRTVEGAAKYAIKFMNKIFFLSSAEAVDLFMENPRTFLFPFTPRPTCKLVVFGPKYSGKSDLCKKLARVLKGTVINVNEIGKSLDDADSDVSFYSPSSSKLDEKTNMIANAIHSIPNEELDIEVWRDGGYIVDGMYPDADCWKILVENSEIVFEDAILLFDEDPYDYLLSMWHKVHRISDEYEGEYENRENEEEMYGLIEYLNHIRKFEVDWKTIEENVVNTCRNLIACNIGKLDDVSSYVISQIEDRYTDKARVMTEEEKEKEKDLAEYMAMTEDTENIEDEEEEEEEREGHKERTDVDIKEDNRRFGDTSHYCPVALLKHNVFWKGKEEFSAVFMDRIYYLSSESALEEFLRGPQKLGLPLKKPLPLIPPLRISVIGPTGSGKSRLSDTLSRECGLAHVDYFYSCAMYAKSCGAPLITHMDVIVSPEKLLEEVELPADMNDERYNSDSATVQTFVRSYWKNGSDLPAKMYQECILKHFKGLFGQSGVVLNQFPSCRQDVEIALKNYIVPEVIIELRCGKDTAYKRIMSLMLETWQHKLEEKKVEESSRYATELEEYEIKRDDWIEHMLSKNRRRTEEEGEMGEFEGEEFMAEYMEDQEEEATVLTRFELEEIWYRDNPQPVLFTDWETEEVAKERMDQEFHERYNNESVKVDAVRESLEGESIMYVTIDGEGDPTEIFLRVMRILEPYVCRNVATLEKVYTVDVETAETLLNHGYYLLSSFGRWCPVQLCQNKVPLHMFLPQEVQQEIHAVIHRQFIYFLSEKEAHSAFLRNPFKYFEVDSCVPVIPFRLAIIGPPKCGKSTLAERFAKKYNIKVITRGAALRHVMKSFAWTEFVQSAESSLRLGKTAPMECVYRAIEMYSIDPSSVSQGFVLDGFPVNREEYEALTLLSIQPMVILDLKADLVFCLECLSQGADYTTKPTNFSNQFLTHRYTIWQADYENYRSWLQKFTQNIIEVDATMCRWYVWTKADKEVCSRYMTIRSYFRESDYEKVHRLKYMSVSPYEFTRRQSQFEFYCPMCLYLDDIMRFSGPPPDHEGMVQFREHFYWICPQHLEQFVRNPLNYLPPMNDKCLPKDRPRIITETIDPEHPCWTRRLQVKGFCLVTYVECLPDRRLVPGKISLAVIYKSKVYIFCTEECREKFLAQPDTYTSVNIKFLRVLPPVDIHKLPHLGFLEQTVSRRVPVPDARFDYLCEYFKPASKVPAFLNVVDIAGLVKGAAEGQGLGNNFLSHINACDGIFHLARAFDDDDVTHIEGDVNPVRDLEIISEELRLKDIEFLNGHLEKLEKLVVRGNDKKLKPEYDTLLKVKGILVDEKRHIRFADWSATDIEVLNKYLFLTSKPVIYLVNLSEKDYIRKKNKWLIKIKEWVDKNDPGAILIPFSGVFENKLADMNEAERAKYLEENKVTSALDKIIVQGYKALQLQYFFTAGHDEVKAWTIQKGAKAPQAAGKIHTDFEKGFIMAEVMKFEDFKNEGSEAAVKAAGKYRQQGRNYVVEDGDIIFFKFNAGAGLKDAKKK